MTSDVYQGRKVKLKHYVNTYLVHKDTQKFHSHFFLGKIMDCQNYLNSVVSPFNTELDCIVSSQIRRRARFRD